MTLENKNRILNELIEKLKKLSIDKDVKLWKRIASDLEKSTRNRRVVNLSKISRYSKEGIIVVVPGKVLAGGNLEHPVNVVAYNFSKKAFDEINKKGSAITLNSFIEKNPKAKNIKIIG